MATQFEAGFTSEGVFVPDSLLVQGPFRDHKVILKAGAFYRRGTVLGKITADSKRIASASAAIDGSQVPIEVLISDVDATAGDAEGLAYITGDFNQNALTFGAGHSPASTREALQDRGIFLRNVS